MKSVNAGRGLVLVKIVVEACYLDDKMKRLVCKIVEDVGADFIKTSTGKGPGGATVLTWNCFATCSPRGGCQGRRWHCDGEDAELMINTWGRLDLGTSHAVRIMKEFSGERE